MSSRSRSIATHAALAVMLAAPAVHAQDAGAPVLAPADSAAVALVAAPAAGRAAPVDSLRVVGGAPLVGAGIAVRAPARAPATAPTMAAPGALRQSQVLMIVGGAAVVLGLVAGGDAEAPLVVGGAIIGLFGLYQYLK